MAAIDIATFRLAAGIAEADVLAADRDVQTQFAYRQPGLLRRTTARAGDGEWLVVTVWSSGAEAQAADRAAAGDPLVAAFEALMDEGSRQRRRYETLD